MSSTQDNIGKKEIKLIPDLTDDILYVKDDDLRLSTTSWASEIETEMGNSFSNEKLTGSSTISSWNEKSQNNTDFSDLKKIDIDSVDDLFLLETQSTVVSDVRKEIKKYNDEKLVSQENIDNVVKKLGWLQTVSKKFSDKLNLTITLHNSRTKSVPRSSYKFCDNGYDCEYNYNHKKHDGCCAQHFVHNFVYADLAALISYLNTVDAKEVKLNEVIKCINTISYVIGHMKDELKNLSCYYPEKYLDLHRERNPRIRKKNRKKKKPINITVN